MNTCEIGLLVNRVPLPKKRHRQRQVTTRRTRDPAAVTPVTWAPIGTIGAQRNGGPRAIARWPPIRKEREDMQILCERFAWGDDRVADPGVGRWILQKVDNFIDTFAGPRMFEVSAIRTLHKVPA